jgi:hypothetical protein
VNNHDNGPVEISGGCGGCRHRGMFNFAKPKAAGDWIVHIAGAHRRHTPCGLDAADVRTVRVLNPVMVDECYGDCSPVETIA